MRLRLFYLVCLLELCQSSFAIEKPECGSKQCLGQEDCANETSCTFCQAKTQSNGLIFAACMLPADYGPIPKNYTVLNDTDFFGFNAGSKRGCKSFEECAQACWESPSCMCASWNGPDSSIKDLNCNFHCSSEGKRSDKGEVAAVIRTGKTCHAPPTPPPSPAPVPVSIPEAWIAREQTANMYIANNQPMVVGNGYVAAMTHTNTMYVAGVFNGDLTSKQEPVRADIPSFWDGFVIESNNRKIPGDFASALDVGISAVYSIGGLPGGGSLETRKYAHRSMPHVVGVDFTFNNSASTTALTSTISQPSSWGSISTANISTKDTTWSHSSTSTGMTCWAGSVEMSEDPTLPLIHLGLCTTDLRSSPVVINVPAGEIKTYSVLAAIYSTQDHPSPLTPAAQDFRTAAALPVKTRWNSHVAKVGETLESGIEVSGNHDLAKLVNASFHTLVAALRAEPEYWYSSSPGGLATDCYHGHTFWDMETWMYPNLLFFHPDLATGTVMYRVHGLPWAKQYARDTGRMGARYPWQTAASGKVASNANAAEIHIVGDVALSMWQYYAATQNTTWLKEHGLPTLAATAEFFAAWAQSNPDGTFSLNHTQGPDEFHTGDDSCYVNAAAALNLRSAANFSEMLGEPYPTNWTEIAAKVRLPFDINRQMHLEYAEWTDAMKAKQADTIMLSYPLGVEMPRTVRKNDLDYYASHTGNGPSMTWSMYAVGYLEIGEMEKVGRLPVLVQ
jgi:hypothetical protein